MDSVYPSHEPINGPMCLPSLGWTLNGGSVSRLSWWTLTTPRYPLQWVGELSPACWTNYCWRSNGKQPSVTLTEEASAAEPTLWEEERETRERVKLLSQTSGLTKHPVRERLGQKDSTHPQKVDTCIQSVHRSVCPHTLSHDVPPIVIGEVRSHFEPTRTICSTWSRYVSSPITTNKHHHFSSARWLPLRWHSCPTQGNK